MQDFIKEERFEIRLNKSQKQELYKVAKDYGMTLSDYTRYKLLEDNSDLSKKYIFESPPPNQHNYYSMGILNDLYFLLLDLISKNGGDVTKISNECRELSRVRMGKFGYLKIKPDSKIEAEDE